MDLRSENRKEGNEVTLSSCQLVVWHPWIHDLYGETLHYFLLKVRPTINTIEVIDKLLEENNVMGRCLYEVYGTYDYMLRTWLTDNKRASLIKKIMGSKYIRTAHEFIANTDSIDFFQDKVDRIPLIEKATRDYSSEIIRKAKKGDAKILNDLKKDGLIVKLLPATSQPRIKFFWLLRCPPAQQPFVVQPLREYLSSFMEQETSAIKELSFYLGTGFADFIIKGVASDYFAIRPFVMEFLTSSKAQNFDLGSETLLVTTSDFSDKECDYIDFDIGISTHQRTLIETILGVSDSDIDKLHKLPRKDKHAFLEQLEEIYDKNLFSFDDDKILVQMFKAFLTDDNNLIRSALALLFINLERTLRIFFITVMKELYGKTWQEKSLTELKRKVGIDDEQKLKSFTIINYVSILGYLDKHHNQHISNELGAEWQKNIREAAEWRNLFFHGKLDNPIEQWQPLLIMAANLLPIYSRIKEKTQSDDTKGG